MSNGQTQGVEREISNVCNFQLYLRIDRLGQVVRSPFYTKNSRFLLLLSLFKFSELNVSICRHARSQGRMTIPSVLRWMCKDITICIDLNYRAITLLEKYPT